MSTSKSAGQDRLQTYLNDHLAGSVAAIELLDDVIEHHPHDRFTEFSENLRDDIRADQETLRDLALRTGAKESPIRKAGAWLAEKFGRMKFGDADDSTGLLQVLEALALGITGKQLLWRTLEMIAPSLPALQGTDFTELKRRAQDQFERVEAMRMQMAREAFRA